MQQLHTANNDQLQLETLHIWSHGMYCERSDGTEALIFRSDECRVASHTSVDIVVRAVRPPGQHLGSCKQFLDALVDICERQLGEQTFARHVLNCKAVQWVCDASVGSQCKDTPESHVVGFTEKL